MFIDRRTFVKGAAVAVVWYGAGQEKGNGGLRSRPI
jgi:hypothetical protein